MRRTLVYTCLSMFFTIFSFQIKAGSREDPETFDAFVNAVQENHLISVKAIKQYVKLDNSFFKGQSIFRGEFGMKVTDNVYVIILKHFQGNYVKDILITFNKIHEQITYKSIISSCKECKSTDLFADLSFESEERRKVLIEYYEPIFQKAKILESQRKIKKTEHWYITDKGYILKSEW
ncbi:hypothetical protein QNI15_33440 [Cytophagaceae bacterium NT2B1]|nr:hypothetical protein [Xanthocytophaga flavus]